VNFSIKSIKIEVFEGPFELLCHLIEKNKIDIYDIPISVIADQYMDYLFSLQEFDLEVASEFLVMASRLLHIKSRMLLPISNEKDDEDQEDPRDELVVSVIEYMKYKEFALKLKSREAYWGRALYKFPEIIETPVGFKYSFEYNIDGDGLFEVYRKLQETNMRRFDSDRTKINKIIENERVSLVSKLKEIAGYLKVRASFIFNRAFDPEKRPKPDVVTAFYALLELNRQELISVKQNKMFGDLKVTRRRDASKIDYKRILD